MSGACVHIPMQASTGGKKSEVKSGVVWGREEGGEEVMEVCLCVLS